jgi:hypothetical protein
MTMEWTDACPGNQTDTPDVGKDASMDATSDATKFRGIEKRIDGMKVFILYVSNQFESRETDESRAGIQFRERPYSFR